MVWNFRKSICKDVVGYNRYTASKSTPSMCNNNRGFAHYQHSPMKNGLCDVTLNAIGHFEIKQFFFFLFFIIIIINSRLEATHMQRCDKAHNNKQIFSLNHFVHSMTESKKKKRKKFICIRKSAIRSRAPHSLDAQCRLSQSYKEPAKGRGKFFCLYNKSVDFIK